MRYSICITHYNDDPLTVRRSLDSILCQINQDFEIIVVDNFSNNGSDRVLQDYANKGKIQLYKLKSTRGKARQYGFERSQGRYILSHFDLDDIFNPILPKLLEVYHSNFEGMMIKINSTPIQTSCTISPVSLLREIGGWPDTQFFEDYKIWSEALKMGKYGWINADLLAYGGEHEDRKGLVKYNLYRFQRYRDAYKLGFALKPANSGTGRLIRVLAFLSTLPHKNGTRYFFWESEEYRMNALMPTSDSQSSSSEQNREQLS